MKQAIVVLLVCTMLAGCATTRAWDQPGERVLQKVQEGDRVTIVATNGKTYRMVVTEVSEDTLYGLNRQLGKKYVVAFFDNMEQQNWDLCGGN